MTDQPVAELVAAAAAGDDGAWDRIVERFSGLVWSVARCHGLAPADAADVSQTVWLRLVEHLGHLHHPERLPGWLLTTTRNEAQRVKRQLGRHVPMADMADLDAGAGAVPVDAALLDAERDVLVWAGFQRLPMPCRLLLRLLVTDPPLTYADISAALGMPVGSIGPTRARCLDRLRNTPEIFRITADAPGS